MGQPYLAVVAYLKGDLATASSYANLDVSNTYPLGIVARALVAARDNDRNRAQKLAEQLVALYPIFGLSPRRTLEKFIRSREILNRLTGDLEALGLGSGNATAAH